jgi:hypothetical protein
LTEEKLVLSGEYLVSVFYKKNNRHTTKYKIPSVNYFTISGRTEKSENITKKCFRFILIYSVELPGLLVSNLV